jgi:hypothetical protein
MMNRNPHFLLGLADALSSLRRSFLMDASSFRVGTRFSKSFLPLSIRGLR